MEVVCIMKKSLYWINKFLAIIVLTFSIIILILIPYQTTELHQKYGATPRDFPYLLGVLLLIGGSIMLFDVLKEKKQYVKIVIEPLYKNEIVRLLKYIIVLSFLPILMEKLGFFVGIIIILPSLLLLSEVKNKIIIFMVEFLVVLAIYLIATLIQVRLPSGILF